MPLRTCKFVFAALGVAQLVAGHTLFTNFFVDGIGQGNATCVRMPMTPKNATFPINNLLGDEMACGYNGENGVARVCPADAGSTMTFEYRAIPDDSSAESIDISHKGPCAVYLKKVDSAVNDPAVGDGWFKIWDDGYDESAGKWCTEKLRDNNGHFSVQLPSGLAAGYYLARPELLALHQADKTPSNPQFYIGCAQIFLNSTGTGKPSSTVSIPNYVQPGSPPVHFDIWTTPLALPYPMPGPAVANITDDTASGSTNDKASNVQTEGLQPPSCILSAFNWCGTELVPYTTVEGCYKASSACWAQAKTCYDTAPPTGSFGCRIWEAKCDGIQAQCTSGGSTDNALVQGPPDYMKDLTPPASTLSPLPQPSSTALAQGNVESADDEAAKLSASANSVWASISGTAYVPPAPTMSLSAAAPSASMSGSLKISQDGSCGGSTGQTCQGSKLGDCCSAHGYCGLSVDYCGDGCQLGFGSCGDTAMKMKTRRMMTRHARHARRHL